MSKQQNPAQEKFPKEHLIIQSIRVGMYGVLCLLVLFQHLFQKDFYNWDLYKSFYGIITIGVCFHAVCLSFMERFFADKKWVALSFAVDLILISFLLGKTELSASVFLFLYLIVILLSGIFFQFRGAFLAAVGSSIGLTAATLLGPELKSVSYFFFLILNNILFFVSAFLSAYLSEQLELQGITLGAVRRLNQAMVDSIPMGLVTIDNAGFILSANPVVQGLLDSENLERKNLFQWLPDIQQMLAMAMGQQSRIMKEITFKSGVQDQVHLLRSQVLPQLEGFQQNHLVVLEDLTQIRQMELAVRQSEKLAAVGQLAAGIAHEIRNPLAGISGSIELLSAQAQSEDDKKLKKIILKEIDRLNRLISEFLDFAKPEKVPTDLINVNAIVKETLQAALNDPSKPSDQTVDIDIQNVPSVRGNSDKLRQAFLNMFINAFQAMKDVKSPHLKVRCRQLNNVVDVSITDNGCGMSPETAKRMFEPFMTTKPKGTGLGLAITYKILEMHRAQVFVDSQVGQGTEIHIHFPVIEN